MADESVLNSLKEQFHICMPVFIALGDEVRLTILETLTKASVATPTQDPASHRQGLNVNEITHMTHLSRPAISHHLKILKDAGLITARRQGTSNYYFLTVKQPTKQMMTLGASLQEILNLS